MSNPTKRYLAIKYTRRELAQKTVAKAKRAVSARVRFGIGRLKNAFALAVYWIRKHWTRLIVWRLARARARVKEWAMRRK